MGDIQTDQGEALELQFVPVDEFNRLLDANVPDVARASAFAALARINTLYMIAGAWSGHIGTSFSSLEIMSWLFLNEIRDLDEGPAGVRRLLLVEGARRARALQRADRPRPAARREAAPAASSARPAGASARRDAVHPGQHRLARHGHLEGQGHGARQPSGRQRTPRLRAHRRRRAAGRAVLGVAGIGRQSRARRDRRDRRSQQDSVGHLGPQRQRSRRHRGQVPRLRLARRPLRRPRRRRARTDVPRARRGGEPAEGDHRRHREGEGRLLHGRSGDGGG